MECWLQKKINKLIEVKKMTKNNQHKNAQELVANYQQQKTDFLDNLQPDDFRNGGSFNQAETIIDELNKALHRAALNQENPEEFIKKAVTHLFRENSPAVAKAISLSRSYLQTKLDQT